MKNKPPYMIKVGDLIKRTLLDTILEITDTEDCICFFTGISKIGPASNDPTRTVHDVRSEYIYLKNEDKWLWTGHGSRESIDPPKFYREITKEMDREEQLNKLLE